MAIKRSRIDIDGLTLEQWHRASSAIWRGANLRSRNAIDARADRANHKLGIGHVDVSPVKRKRRLIVYPYDVTV
jgi:hypothetical protein